MPRFCFVIIVSLPIIIFYILKVGYIEKHAENYTEADRYLVARRAISVMQRNGFIHTNVYGAENLPENGGYIMYPNHQGKYDALGIMSVHDTPCTVVMDKQRSNLPIADQFITLLQGSRLDKTDMKSQLKTIASITNQVKSGRRYIIFPEGGYYHNRNDVKDFLPGAFKCAIKSQSPIVPVALIDSYKPFELNSLKPVTTQVHFLEPIYYEEYKEMTSKEIAELTRNRIVTKIQKVCEA